MTRTSRPIRETALVAAGDKAPLAGTPDASILVQRSVDRGRNGAVVPATLIREHDQRGADATAYPTPEENAVIPIPQSRLCRPVLGTRPTSSRG
jgi:hypothetical protein